MKKITLALFCFSTILTYGQKFETNIHIAQVMSFESNETSESDLGFGFSAGVQEYYNLSDHFAVGIGANYSNVKYKLKQEHNLSSIPEIFSNYHSSLNIQSIDVPVLVKYRTNNDWFFQVGYGFTYVLDTKSDVELVYTDLYGDEISRVEVAERNDDLGRNTNTYIYTGIGKGYKMGNTMVYIELYYTQAFQSYNFSHEGINGSEILYTYQVKPQQIGLKIAAGL